jgi:hypothetical protein
MHVIINVFYSMIVRGLWNPWKYSCLASGF